MKNYKAQLFIMPYAGGSKSSFKEIESFVADDIEVITVEYPGRGSRIREPLCVTMNQLISDVKNQIDFARNDSIPFVLFGYSMGCEITFDLAQYALKEKPSYIFLGAREAIHYDTKGHDYALLDINEFAKKIIELGGIDEVIRQDERFLNMAMKPIYADYKLLHDYFYKRDKGMLSQDITIFFCNEDTCRERVYPWNEHTTGKTEFIEMGNNHFFINQYAKEMADIISSRIHRVIGEEDGI